LAFFIQQDFISFSELPRLLFLFNPNSQNSKTDMSKRNILLQKKENWRYNYKT